VLGEQNQKDSTHSETNQNPTQLFFFLPNLSLSHFNYVFILFHYT